MCAMPLPSACHVPTCLLLSPPFLDNYYLPRVDIVDITHSNSISYCSRYIYVYTYLYVHILRIPFSPLLYIPTSTYLPTHHIIHTVPHTIPPPSLSVSVPFSSSLSSRPPLFIATRPYCRANSESVGGASQK